MEIKTTNTYFCFSFLNNEMEVRKVAGCPLCVCVYVYVMEGLSVMDEHDEMD